ncbi:hypothetical protein AAMO2058_001188900 [Amorphochlora amoebiformis]
MTDKLYKREIGHLHCANPGNPRWYVNPGTRLMTDRKVQRSGRPYHRSNPKWLPRPRAYSCSKYKQLGHKKLPVKYMSCIKNNRARYTSPPKYPPHPILSIDNHR